MAYLRDPTSNMFDLLSDQPQTKLPPNQPSGSPQMSAQKGQKKANTKPVQQQQQAGSKLPPQSQNQTPKSPQQNLTDAPVQNTSQHDEGWKVQSSKDSRNQKPRIAGNNNNDRNEGRGRGGNRGGRAVNQENDGENPRGGRGEGRGGGRGGRGRGGNRGGRAVYNQENEGEKPRGGRGEFEKKSGMKTTENVPSESTEDTQTVPEPTVEEIPSVDGWGDEEETPATKETIDVSDDAKPEEGTTAAASEGPQPDQQPDSQEYSLSDYRKIQQKKAADLEAKLGTIQTRKLDVPNDLSKYVEPKHTQSDQQPNKATKKEKPKKPEKVVYPDLLKFVPPPRDSAPRGGGRGRGGRGRGGRGGRGKNDGRGRSQFAQSGQSNQQGQDQGQRYPKPENVDWSQTGLGGSGDKPKQLNKDDFPSLAGAQ